MKSTRIAIIGLMFLLGYVTGAVLHERDMERNFTNTGDAQGWFVDIKCENYK